MITGKVSRRRNFRDLLRSVFKSRAPLLPFVRTQPGPDIKEMAQRCFGYGRWDAPYWFVGLGEGMGPEEDIQRRVEAWHDLGREIGLSDCYEFHKRIRVMQWHRQKPPARLASTWRPLILLLMIFLGEDADKESLRMYQRKNWGMRDGDTCVIELFGLPAPTFAAHNKLMSEHFEPEEIECILRGRIDLLSKKILEHRPKFVVMYGRTARKQWGKIAGRLLPDDEVVQIGSTMMLSATHPTAPNKEGDTYWKKLGEKLRVAAGSANR
jgi:hypothetical protein